MSKNEQFDKFSSLLSKNLSVEKLADFLKQIEPDQKLNCQAPWPSTAQMRWCLGILNELNFNYQDPKLATFLYNLQLGKTAFGETPGQMPWCYTTFDASFCYAYLGLLPNDFDGYVNYINSFLNADGGYSQLGGSSEIFSTIRWTLSLLNMGIKDIHEETIEYLKGCLMANTLSCEDLFYTVTIMDKTQGLSHLERKQIYKRTYRYLLSERESLETSQKYWLCETLKTLVPDIEIGFLRSFIPINWNVTDPFSLYMAVRLSFLFRLPIKRDEAIKRILNYVCRGAFCFRNNVDFFIYAVLKQLFPSGQEEREHFIKVLDYYILKDGRPEGEIVFSLNPKSNFRFVKAYVLMGGIIQPENMKKFMTDTLTYHIQQRNLMSACETLATFKVIGLSFPEALQEEMQVLLNLFLRNRPIMYQVYRQLVCWDIATKTCPDLNIGCDENILKNFILSCEYPEGGFSHLPGEEPCVQSTYHALHALKILKVEIPHKENHKVFLKKCYLEDEGTFVGKIGDNFPLALQTFYAILAYFLLDSPDEEMEIVEPLLFL